MNCDLLQQHTVEIYNLNDHVGKVFQLPACSLLTPQRFDLFAKLYYIDNIDSNKEQALRVYIEHIKAFNPDGREPGRDDKNSISDFLQVFDELISKFKIEGFNEKQSIIPVDRNGVILDGAHRVAALAYYNSNVVVVQFEDVEAKCGFDFKYFKERGLPWTICDTVALEMAKWVKTMMVACIWPSVKRKHREQVISMINEWHQIAYIKEFKCDLPSLSKFVSFIYRAQEWTKDAASVLDKTSRIYGRSNMSLVFFSADCELPQIIKEKEEIRQLLGKGKDSIHITDNYSESIDIARVTLDANGVKQWMQDARISRYNVLCSKIKERWFIFRRIQWVSFKVLVYNFFKSH